LEITFKHIISLVQLGILLRGCYFWHVKPPSISFWSWRKILLNRDWCRRVFISCIGDEDTTSLWLDYWLPDEKQFYDLLPFRVLHSSRLPWDAKVSYIIKEGSWAFPSDSPHLQTIWDPIDFHPRICSQDHMFRNVTLLENS